MEAVLTSKVQLIFASIEDQEAALKSMNAYREACNFVSEYIFNNGFPLNQNVLQKELYHQVRKDFGLKSQMAQSVMKTVVARYRTSQTQLSQQKVWDGYKKDNHGKEVPNYISKGLDFLWKPIEFKRPQLDLVRNRDYTIREDGTISLNTLKGRVVAKAIIPPQDNLHSKEWVLGTGKLLRSGKKWFFHIPATKEVEDFSMEQLTNVVGIDRGLRQIVTTYDSQGKTSFVSGKAISKKRKHYKELRASLQAKGTKSAKRRIRSIGQRESRWMNDVNHCLSKTLVEKYGKGTLFVLEDLTNVTFETTSQRKKDHRYEHHSWAFYDLEQKLAYKAELNQSLVIKVDAHYTSQRCPKCGTIDKENRDKHLHEYHCSNCHYRSNDDRVGAMNIQELGKLYVSGIEKPTFNTVNR